MPAWALEPTASMCPSPDMVRLTLSPSSTAAEAFIDLEHCMMFVPVSTRLKFFSVPPANAIGEASIISFVMTRSWSVSVAPDFSTESVTASPSFVPDTT